ERRPAGTRNTPPRDPHHERARRRAQRTGPSGDRGTDRERPGRPPRRAARKRTALSPRARSHGGRTHVFRVRPRTRGRGGSTNQSRSALPVGITERTARMTSTLPVPNHVRNGTGPPVSALLIPADPEQPVRRIEIVSPSDGWINGDVVLIAFDEREEKCDVRAGLEDSITPTERL